MESLRENMTSSTKPEIHNVSQRLQKRTEPRPNPSLNPIPSPILALREAYQKRLGLKPTNQ